MTKHITQEYLDLISQDIYDYLEERLSLDGIYLSNIDPIKILARKSRIFVGCKDGKKCFKTESRLYVNISSIEREDV